MLFRSIVIHALTQQPEQIIINDHTSTDNTDDLELVKGIYDKMDKETAWRDAEIKRLQEELKIAKGNDIPYIQLTREIRNAYPAVTEVHISQGASVTSDSLKLSPCLSVIISCSEALSPEDANRLNEWLKIRMETEDIILVQKQ